MPVSLLLLAAASAFRPAAVVGRAGLQSRPVRIRTGAAAGLVVDVGWGETDPLLGSYEVEVQRALAFLVHPRDVVYDIGAHTGYLSLVAARYTGDRGAVYAFEPDRTNAELARANVDRNALRHVTVVDEAVGPRSGSALLQRSTVPARHRIVDPTLPTDHDELVEVAVVSIDDFVARDGVRPPDLIKIDVEGFEAEVVAGMAATLRDHSPTLLIEFDGTDRAAAVQRSRAVADTLASFGYELTELAPSYVSDEFAVIHLVARSRHHTPRRLLPLEVFADPS